jgi:glycogen synthase
MNICFFSQEYPPNTHVGGIGTYTYNMAGAMAASGHTVHVIISGSNGFKSYTDNGVVIHPISQKNLKPLELSRLMYSIAAARELGRTGCKFDIVQASEYGSEAFWLSLHKQVPLVTRLATPSFLIEKLNGKTGSGRRPFCRFMEKQQTLRSDGIFTSTKALALAVAKEWEIRNEKISVIPNSIDISRVIRLGENGACPEELRGHPFMLYFGRLEERKGVRVLADALPAVFEQFNDVRMVFVGADLGYRGAPMQEYILARAGRHGSRVRFFDRLPHAELLPIVRAAKLVILPSLWEAFGFVSVEAMALGRPVIATSGSGFEEIIEKNVSGYLVEPGHCAPLAEQIIQCLGNESGLLKISSKARERAQDFEVSRMALRLIDYFEKVRARWLQQGGAEL